MQGTLNEIDIRSILQLIELGQRTGELFVEAYTPQATVRGSEFQSQEGKPRSSEPFWFVFFLNGQIVYAADSNGGLFRLRDYLKRYSAIAALDRLELPPLEAMSAPEYSYLWAMLENHILTPAQGRSIISSMVQETLFDLLSLHQGSFVFESSPALSPQLTTLEINPLVTKIMKQVQEWKQFYPHIQSPEQCPAISDPEQLRAALPENAFQTLDISCNGKTSLRQLSRHLNRDILTVAKAIYPYIQQGWVHLPLNTPAPATTLDRPVKMPSVVCIDDDVAIGKAVEYILKQQGYDLTVLSNPLKAISLVFQLKPDLILCDIAMPELDGYEICAMLRRSTAFRQTPIIMLTGRDGFIDRVRARIVGSTDYLTKPFGENELLMILEKYIGPGETSHPNLTVNDRRTQ